MSSEQSSISIHGGRPEGCHFHVVDLPYSGAIGLWIDGAGEEPIANLRLTDDDARRLANAILACRITNGAVSRS